MGRRQRKISDSASLLKEFNCDADDVWDIGTELWEDGGGIWPVGVALSDKDGNFYIAPDEATGVMLVVGNGWGHYLPFPFTIPELFAAVREQDRDVTGFEYDLATDGLFVVETLDGDAYLGAVKRRGDITEIRSGLPGRPIEVRSSDILKLTAAGQHPDVELLNKWGEPIPR